MALTYFFRDLGSLELAISHVMPQIAGRSRIRIWDAGCAMGQEPFTLAMLLAEALGPMMFRNVEIIASDYDKSVIQVLDAAVYVDEELQRVPELYYKRYLEASGNEGTHRVAEPIRKAVRSLHHDLLSFTPVCDRLSLIVCKNVLLHFNQAERIKVFKVFHDALEPQGQGGGHLRPGMDPQLRAEGAQGGGQGDSDAPHRHPGIELQGRQVPEPRLGAPGSRARSLPPAGTRRRKSKKHLTLQFF